MGIYYLYADGACQPNPGAGGWGFVLFSDDMRQRFIRQGFEGQSTNNRMELTAVLEGMLLFQKIREQSDCRLIIRSDSKYLCNGVNQWSHKWARNGWKKADKSPIENPDLWKRIRLVADDIDAECLHIKGHAGHSLNEFCDQLAVEIIKKDGLLQNLRG